jgi:deazaflavin-dependent oxidoreductase (nitroreductase family)
MVRRLALGDTVHGVADTFLYLTTTGRVSGQPRTIEIWFVEHGGCAYIVAEHRERTHWVQNIVAQPVCAYSIGTGDDREAAQRLSAAIGRPVAPAEQSIHGEVSRLMFEKYGWSNGLIVELRPEAC